MGEIRIDSPGKTRRVCKKFRYLTFHKSFISSCQSQFFPDHVSDQLSQMPWEVLLDLTPHLSQVVSVKNSYFGSLHV